MRKLILLLICSLMAGTALAGVKNGEKAPGFSLKNQQDAQVNLADYEGKLVVLEFINFGCPFVKKHYRQGHMQALQKKYRGQGVVWLQICSSAEGRQGFLDPKGIQQKLMSYKSETDGYLSDASGTVGKTYSAKTTPHMFVIDKEGKVAYQGAIDKMRSSKTSDIGQKGNTNYVAQALDELMAGQAVSVPKTKSYGCGVKYAK